MGLINKEGKLFGIINVIDLAVIALIAVVAVGGLTRLKKVAPQVISEGQKAMVTLEISDVRQPTVDGVEVGDELYHYDKEQYFGKIVSKEVSNYEEAVPTSDGKMVLAEVPGKYKILLSIESTVVNSKDFLSIGGEQVRVGTQYRIKNKKVSTFGTVFKVDIEE